jgi:DASH complex subunit SPC19
MSTSSAASLSASVASLRSSLSLLDSSIAILDSGISDFPRLSTVLTTTRVSSIPYLPVSSSTLSPYSPPFPVANTCLSPHHPSAIHTYRPTQHFELTPSSSLTAAQASLASELRPAITTLLQRVESHCAKLERREQALVAKSELQEGRLGQGGRSGGSGTRNSRGKGGNTGKVVVGGGEMGVR